MTERRSLIAWEERAEGYKGHKKNWAMEWFTLTVWEAVTSTGVYTYIQAYQSVHFTFVQLILCWLYSVKQFSKKVSSETKDQIQHNFFSPAQCRGLAAEASVAGQCWEELVTSPGSP